VVADRSITITGRTADGLFWGTRTLVQQLIVSPQHLTREDVRGILDEAKRYHVEVNADVDTPGHLDHILSFHPELQLVLANGTRHRGHLDYSKPAARRLVHEIVDEMCDLFDGPVFHLGGDEFFPAPWQGTGPDVVSAASAPQLVEYARQVTGDPDATIFDGYEMYLNELGDLVRAKGKIARMWNDDIYPGEGVSRIDPRTQADVWIRWRSYKPTAGDYVDAGHDVINSNGDYLYFILTGGGVGTGPWKNPKGIYERWTPRTFMGVAGSAGDYILPADKPMLGSHLSVWCDDPSSLTQDQVADHLQEWLQVFAQQTWGSPKPTATLEELRTAVLEKVGTAPAG
jgi:hexosaminidase